MKEYIISEDSEGNRLDKIIPILENSISRTAVQRMIDNGLILVNNKKLKASYKVNKKDIITIEKEEVKNINLEAQEIPLEVIYEDKDIIVVNKPKGLVVHPAIGNPDNTLVNAIMAICKDSLSGIGGELRPGIVHRLDKDTSGILIVAKTDIAHMKLSDQIKNREISKRYIALVRGNIKENYVTINMPIGRSTKDRKKMAVVKNGKEAITHFDVIKRYNNYTLLDIKIDTGRTHQIRVHMAQIGYPIVGDITYSNGKNPFGVVGQMLHAKSLEFIHPISNEKMYLEAHMPEYFKDVLKQLDNEKE